MRRRWIAAVLAAIGGLLSQTASLAHAAAPSYVALGDSYSAGVGTRTYYSDGTACYRSPKTYSVLVAAAYGLDLTLVACSGAVTGDVVTRQASALRTGTRFVSITIGGNDVGFSSILTECAKPGWMSNCSGAVSGGLSRIRSEMPVRVAKVLATIRSRSPHARVVVAGYPRIFNGEDCNAATFFSPTEEARLNGVSDELNTVLRSQTAAAGMVFVNPAPRFAGHAVCDDPEWINGFSSPRVNSYHPKAIGYQSYAALVGPALVGAAAARTAGEVGRQAAGQRIRLPDSTSSSGTVAFTPPDLSGAKATQSARRVGITPAELTQLRQASIAGASNATLERLNERVLERVAQRAEILRGGADRTGRS